MPAPSLPALAAKPVIGGDPNRFQYAFFTYQPVGYGTRGDVPFFGVVFTEDANFCTRDAAPLHVSEFTAYQLWSSQEYALDANVLYNTLTYPDLDDWYGPWSPSNPPPGYDALGFRGSCLLFDTVKGGGSFPRASWVLTPPSGEALDTAKTVTVSLHARNDAQEVAWTLPAQRCANAIHYFQSMAGNHIRAQGITCVRTFLETKATTSSPADADASAAPAP